MFEGKIIKQKIKINQLENENLDLYEENKELKTDIALLENYKNENEKLQNQIIRDLLDLQEINSLGIAEEEKNKHRNIIINKIINELVHDHQSTN